MRGHNTTESDPFARLTETHRRLEERLENLERAALDLREGIGPKAALEDVHEIVGFLGRGARRHVEDEESTLFPRLRALIAQDAAAATIFQPILERLAHEHAAHRALEDELTTLVGSWGERGPSGVGLDRLVDLAGQLRAVYAEHILHEERALFPAAQQALPPDVIDEMGREMMERRPDRGRDGGRGGGRDRQR